MRGFIARVGNRLPFIEGEDAAFSDHSRRAVQSSSVDSWRRVHIPRLDDVDR